MKPAGLLSWLESADDRHGLHCLCPGSDWTRISYRRLAGAAAAVAARLATLRIGAGARIGVVASSAPKFAAGFFGTLMAGMTPAPLAPPTMFQASGDYELRLAKILAALEADCLITEPGLASQLACLADLPVLSVTPDLFAPDLLASGNCPEPVRVPEMALIQCTSGSSGRVRAVTVPATALEANIAAIRTWLAMKPEDATATWLPFHHDMGLVGCLLTPVVNGSDVWIMRPDDFLRDPAIWLGCFGQHGATLSAAPPFALAYVVRRLRGQLSQNWDFSGWRALVVGAERVDQRTLDRFAELLAPCRFASGTLVPAYGLAEATLVVTGTPLGRGGRTILIDRRSLAMCRPVRCLRDEDRTESASAVTGCGTSVVPGNSVRIIDDGGRELPDGYIGEIEVRGPSIAAGYAVESGTEHGGFRGGVLRTGDSGFACRGELFVLGRIGDSLKCGARTVFAEDVEAAMARTEPRYGRSAAILGNLQGADTAIVIIERRPGPWAHDIAKRLRHLVPGVRLIILAGPPGTVLRTSSGKPRRRAMWDAFCSGTLGGTVASDTSTAG